MDGSKREKVKGSGVWELRVYVGRDPLTGKPRYVSETFRGTERQAGTAKAKMVARLMSEHSPATEATFEYLLHAWFKRNDPKPGVDGGWSPTTAAEYGRIIEQTLVPNLGDRKLAKLTGRDLDVLYDSLTDKGLSGSTVGQVHAIARRACGQAVKWGWIPRNPALDATPPSRRHDEVVPPTIPELQRVLEAATQKDPAFAVLLIVKAALGLRRGEVCGLRWQDIDLTTGRVQVRHSVAVVKDRKLGGTVQKPKARTIVLKGTKTKQNRSLTMDANTLVILKDHHDAAVRRAWELAGVRLAPTAFVFSPEPSGKVPLRPNRINDAWRPMVIKLGLPHISPHDLRHLNASLQLAAGVPLATVSKRLGHANQTTTLNIYSHAMPDDDAVASDVLGRLLHGDQPIVAEVLDVRQAAAARPAISA